ncbi:MAG TPA: hypothetical protein VEA59_00790 [Patescibacteria group bacterium]|nr:hypothetical protein [Patescibacteria group bacterium]
MPTKFITPYGEETNDDGGAKKPQKTNSKNFTLLASTLLMFLVLGAGGFYFYNYNPFGSDYQPSTSRAEEPIQTAPTATLTKSKNSLILKWSLTSNQGYVESKVVWNEKNFPKTPQDGELLGTSSSGQLPLTALEKGYISVFNFYDTGKITLGAQLISLGQK